MHPIITIDQLRLRHDDLLREAAAFRTGNALRRAVRPRGRHARPRPGPSAR